MFIEPGIKINGAYYRDVLLGHHLLPAIRSVAGLHETSSLSNRTMLQLSELVTPWSFCLAIHQISSHRCSGRPSPDLNPVDYEVWGVLQQRVYRSRNSDVDHLKQRLIEEWRCFDH